MIEKDLRIIRVMMVDDDPEALDLLEHFVNLTDGLELVTKTNNPQKALSLLKTSDIDLLFLDMEMPVLSGLQILAQLKLISKSNPAVSRMQVVACSAYEHFAAKTYNYKIADYLTKPVLFERYTEAVDEVKKRMIPPGLNRLAIENKCFLIHVNRGKTIHRLAFSDIVYLEAREHKTRLWTSDTMYYDIRMVMKKVLLLLPKSQFIKVHRGYAISLAHFEGKTERSIALKGLERQIPQGEPGSFPIFESWLAENALRGKPAEEHAEEYADEKDG